jgi:hypothetical protein
MDDSVWEVTLLEITHGKEKKYKVTRRIPFYSVAETKIFATKAEAKKQIDEWLQ